MAKQIATTTEVTMTYAEKLDIFAELATAGHLGEEYTFWDASDPDNRRLAMDYFAKELGFLSGKDSKELKYIWNLAVEDCRQTKIFFNAIKVLKDRYDYGTKPYDEADRSLPF